MSSMHVAEPFKVVPMTFRSVVLLVVGSYLPTATTVSNLR